MKHKPKTITAFTHPAPPSAETPDTKPGNYYVSVRETSGEAFWLALGPFINNHAGALAAVDAVRGVYYEHDRSGKAPWMAYGTVRMTDDVTKPGVVNAYLPELLAA